MGIRDKPTAPASPWQNGFAERLIGSIRRECVDHFVVLGRHICAESCEPMLAITMTPERTGLWIKMRRSLARFSGPESSNRTPFLADFITITYGFRFSVHTGCYSGANGRSGPIRSETTMARAKAYSLSHHGRDARSQESACACRRLGGGR
jgi:transposase InsO family protein